MIHIVAAVHVANTSIVASAARFRVPTGDWESGCSAWLMLASRVAAAVAAGRTAMRMTTHAIMVAFVGGEKRLAHSRIAAPMLVLTVAVAGVVAGGTVGGSGVVPWRVADPGEGVDHGQGTAADIQCGWHAWRPVVPRHDPPLQNWQAVSPVFSCHCVKERFSDRDAPAAKWAYGQ
ncbi:hypothetical protein CYMTET_13232 [Cymbomonas tetramitiformis]|uniref:Uncharacterized protein n=1 Tax=Cymbomonas tetramitiformis TaxID=36881 RepID=A0AAE0GK28_9CHLO|nr:hypothetical protein CYMTET_13232 [Cymbomonas tetramitiformis]